VLFRSNGRYRLEGRERLVLRQVRVERSIERGRVARKLARGLGTDERTRLFVHHWVMKARLHEERATNLSGLDRRSCLELAAVCEQLYQPAQNLVVGANADVLLQRLFERRARTPLVRLEERREVTRYAQILLVVRLDVTRPYLFAALPT